LLKIIITTADPNLQLIGYVNLVLEIEAISLKEFITVCICTCSGIEVQAIDWVVDVEQ